MNIVVGTAGHIDHGKTALIKALTGVDTDRLPEEKRRGITVDLGFAEMSVGDVHIGFVDVPGHERFVKNMLAGASGIDAVILVIAADDGVMPQTREHFDICRLLGVETGIVAITKSDLVDAETLALAKLDAAELIKGSFLEKAHLISVSSHTGEGIDAIHAGLVEAGAELRSSKDELVARLPIDRSFSMKGFGAVVTGTLASGVIEEGSEMELLPVGRKARVRGLQTHGRPVKLASAGQRVAVNLAGIDHGDIERGMLLTESNTLVPTQIVDVEIEVLGNSPRPLRSRQRVRFHIGTDEVLARVQVLNKAAELAPGAKGFVQLTLESPVVAVPGERFIVRSYSPQITIGGGVIVDNLAAKHRRKDLASVTAYLQGLCKANAPSRIKLLIEASGATGLSFGELKARTGFNTVSLRTAIDSADADRAIVITAERFVARRTFEEFEALALGAIASFHAQQPLAKGIPRETLREKAFAYLPNEIFQAVIASLAASRKVAAEGETIQLAGYQQTLSPTESAIAEKIRAALITSGLSVPKLDDVINDAIEGTSVSTQQARKLLQVLLDSGEIVKVTDEFCFSKDAIDKLTADVRAYADASTDRLIDVAQFKEIAGISRKYAIPLLEYFDREKVTIRSGDKRLILK